MDAVIVDNSAISERLGFVTRSEYATVCDGVMQPEGSEEVQRFDSEEVPRRLDAVKAARALKKRFGCPVIVEKVTHIKRVYRMSIDDFKSAATVTEENI